MRERRTEFQAIFVDERKFREWYDVAAGRVYAYCSTVRRRSKSCRGATQLTFIDAIRHRETYDGRADSVTWLIAIGRNRLLDHLRRQEREERRRLRIVVREIAADDGQEAAWHKLEDRDQIVRAMRLLPANQRAALILHHVDGLPVREVAIAMQRSQTAVESLLSRGRERFRMVYESGTVDDDRLLSSLRRIAEPVEPAADFLDRLYEHLADELGFHGTPAEAPIHWPGRRDRPRSRRQPVPLWFAAAILLALAVLGGVLSWVRSSNTARRPTCHRLAALG